MGTNYYWIEKRCSECKRGEEIHIGKSSAGWCFGVHVYPENGIRRLENWKDKWAKEKGFIRDEYNREIPMREMIKIIENRMGEELGNNSPIKIQDHPFGYYKGWDDFYRLNHAEPGPRNLLRYVNDGRFCIGHGDGTWDYLIGYFS